MKSFISGDAFDGWKYMKEFEDKWNYEVIKVNDYDVLGQKESKWNRGKKADYIYCMYVCMYGVCVNLSFIYHLFYFFFGLHVSMILKGEVER